MDRNYLSAFLLAREIGLDKTLDYVPKISQDFQVKNSSYNLTPRMILDIKSKSETIWLGSKENLLISHNSKGNVYCTNLISTNYSQLLNSEDEKAIKIFFTPNSLFLATKSNISNFLDFYLISIISLQNNSCLKERILSNLNVSLNNIKEFSMSSYKVIVEVDENLQIWDILTQQLVKTFPIHPSIMYKYTIDSLIYWQVGKTETKFKIMTTNEETNLSFTIETNKILSFCQILDDELMLVFNNIGLLAVNLKSLKCRTVSQGIPIRIFSFEETNNFTVIFNDGTGIIGLGPETVRFEEFDECLVSEIRSQIFVCGKNGKIGVLTSGKLQILGQGVQETEQICGNIETGEIFVACKGKFYILE